MASGVSKDKSAALRRGGNRQWVLKSQDLVVALKLALLAGKRLAYSELRKSLRLSRFEAHAGVQRLMAARLAVDPGEGLRPIMVALRDFVLHGALYCRPPVRGKVTIGFPTAYAVAP